MVYKVFGKGKGEGKFFDYMINIEVLEYLKFWYEKWGYDYEYLFIIQYGG